MRASGIHGVLLPCADHLRDSWCRTIGGGQSCGYLEDTEDHGSITVGFASLRLWNSPRPSRKRPGRGAGGGTGTGGGGGACRGGSAGGPRPLALAGLDDDEARTEETQLENLLHHMQTGRCLKSFDSFLL